MLRLDEIARLVGGELKGPSHLEITGAATIDEAGPQEITFLAERRYLEAARSSQAACIIVGPDAPDLERPTIRVNNPRLAWAKVLEAFQPAPHFPPGIHETAVIAPDAEIGENVSIQPYVVVGPRTVIGDGVVLCPGVVVGADCRIGDGSVFYPNVTVMDRVAIGQNVIIHPGSVIGADGFGYVPVGGKQHKVPHIGTVIIEDDVEIGANVTVDRGVSGATVIKRGTKIDNLVQVAHNVVIGEDCLVVALTGIAGTSLIGNRVTLAGQSGVAGHLSIGDDSVVASRGLVAKDIPPRSFVSGFPARPHRENMRILASTQKLPEALDSLAQLRRRVEELEQRLQTVEEDLPAPGEPR